ncbi:MAG: hypothetical protein K2L07_10965 [Lachnospiraceae bacterium]|nr:hypothetical protein [Lachnospiraceae bacterium]
MNDKKLEDFKVMSTVSFVIMLAGTIMTAGGEIDNIRTGEMSLWWLVLIFGILTVISFAITVVSSRILKKRQGESYFSTMMYMKAILEMVFPSLLGSHSAKLKKLNVSDANKESNLWKDMCVGCDKENIISFILWFILWSACVWMVVEHIFFVDGEDKIFDVASFSIASIALTIVLIFVASGIKKDPMPIFEYMDITKVKFNEIAKHYDMADNITHKIWMDYKYVFIQSNGKAYCIPVEDYIDMTITFSRTRFVMVLTSTYNCVIKSSFSPIGFRKLKTILETANNE